MGGEILREMEKKQFSKRERISADHRKMEITTIKKRRDESLEEARMKWKLTENTLSLPIEGRRNSAREME